VYYGWYEAQLLTGGRPDSAFAETIAGWQRSASRWIQDVGTRRIGIAVALVVVVAAIIGWIRRPRRSPGSEIATGGSD
jgi:hypothetical protein